MIYILVTRPLVEDDEEEDEADMVMDGTVVDESDEDDYLDDLMDDHDTN